MRILDLNSTLSADYWAAIRLHSLCIPQGGVGWGAEDFCGGILKFFEGKRGGR